MCHVRKRHIQGVKSKCEKDKIGAILIMENTNIRERAFNVSSRFLNSFISF